MANSEVMFFYELMHMDTSVLANHQKLHYSLQKLDAVKLPRLAERDGR